MTEPFDHLGKLGREFLDTSLDSLDAASKDAQAISARASDYAKRLFESGGDAVGKLMAAKSIETAVDIQTAYLKDAYEGFVAETTKFCELYADIAKDAYRPFEAVVVRRK